MSTSTIDYDALAKQHGGSVTVDYDALAAQHGGTAQSGEKPSEWSISSVLSGTSPLHQAIDRAAQTEPEDTSSVGGFLRSTANNLGAGATRVFSPLAHPIDTAAGLGQTVNAAIDPQARANLATKMVEPFVRNPGGEAVAAIPQAVLAYAGRGETPPEGDVSQAVQRVAGKTAQAVGGTAEDMGTHLMNRTVGTLKSDFKRGANPARGYLETGNGPAISMASLADKASEAVDATKVKLDTAYKAADTSGKIIPVQDVANAIAGPMREAYDVATGVGAPKGLLEDLKYHASTFQKVFAEGQEQGGFTPSQVWKIKKDLAKATSWSDPTQVGLKSVTQQQVGALSGVLKDAVPETAPLNQNYMDLLKMSGRAEERANTGSRPLTANIYKALLMGTGAVAGGMEGHALLGAAVGTALDSVPAKTTLATGLFRGGRSLSALGDRLASRGAVIPDEVSAQTLGGNGANYKPGNPQMTPQMLRDAAVRRFLAAQNRQ